VRPDAAVRALAGQVRALRPPADTSIDQCHLDAESLCRRLLAIRSSRPMAQARVAFVGDDDLASVGLLRSAPPEHLLLLDIDERILATVRGEAERVGLGSRVDTERVDLSAPGDVTSVAARYAEAFDVVVTDPPYAHDGMARFVQIAMTLAAYTGELHVAVPALLAEAWTDELLYAVQACLTGSGFLIERVVPGAFTYETSDVVSSLLVARRLPGGPARATPAPAPLGADRFYTTRVVPGQEPLLRPDAEMEREP